MKHRIPNVYIAVLLSLMVASAVAQQPDAGTIIQRSVTANDADWKANPKYDWTERDLQPGGGTKTFQEFMIFGSPYARVVAVNGKPVPASKRAEEQQELDAEISKRRAETAEQRQKRIAEFDKERSREHAMMEQLTQAFNFKLLGEQRLASHQVYVLKAAPKPGYQPPNMQCEALKGMQGKLWIDKTTFQWLRVEAEVVHPVTIEGFLARVEPGTRFELEKTPVDGGIWLPKHYSMRSKAKVLFLLSHRGRDDESYWAYHKSKDY